MRFKAFIQPPSFFASSALMSPLNYVKKPQFIDKKLNSEEAQAPKFQLRTENGGIRKDFKFDETAIEDHDNEVNSNIAENHLE